jgi:uncharacterized membrane protein YjdF
MRLRSKAHWLLGDWGAVVRDPIDILRLTFLGGAIVLLAAGNGDGAVRMFITFVALVGARFLELPRLFDLGLVFGMALQGWGNAVGLFTSISWWDSLVHFALPFWVAPLFYILLIRLDLVPDLSDDTHRRHHHGIVLVTFALGLAFGAIYEIYEWFADYVLGANLYVGYTDTIKDLTEDAVGSIAGGLLLLLWATRGWGTVRRVPARFIPDEGSPAPRHLERVRT